MARTALQSYSGAAAMFAVLYIRIRSTPSVLSISHSAGAAGQADADGAPGAAAWRRHHTPAPLADPAVSAGSAQQPGCNSFRSPCSGFGILVKVCAHARSGCNSVCEWIPNIRKLGVSRGRH